MAKRHFLSVLGTGNYSEAVYTCGEESVTTPYIQEAVLKLKMLKEGPYTEEDRITVFLTEKSLAFNWHDRDYTEKELQYMTCKGGTEKTVRKAGLGPILQKSYGVTDEAARLIPLGATEEELWEIFNIMYDEIQEGEELYVDITHSLRNIPIQMLSVIAYARVLKNVEVKGIYYGAFEAGTRNQDGMTEAPIFDLLTFLDILDWSQAANSFVKFGNSDEIKALCEAQKEKGNKDLRKVVSDLSEITQGLETSRGCYAPDKGSVGAGVSAMKSCRSYTESYEIMRKKEKKAQKKLIDPLGKLFDIINDKLKVFDVEDNLAFGLAAIDWSIENKKTQQGFTALDETIKTYLCRRYGLDEYLELHREGICKHICILFEKELQEMKDSQLVYSEEGREKVYRKWEEASAHMAAQEREAARRLSMELPPVLPQISNEIGSRRNSMNHFGFSNINQFSCQKLYKDLRACNDKFREAIVLMENGAEE